MCNGSAGVGFSLMKKETYEKKPKVFLQAEQFSERKNMIDNVIIKTEKDKQGITRHEKEGRD